MMTPEQRLDRLERVARLLYEAVVRDSRRCRDEAKKLRAYWAVMAEYDAAKLAEAENPENDEVIERLCGATESRNHAYDDLRRTIENGRRRLRKRNPNSS